MPVPHAPPSKHLQVPGMTPPCFLQACNENLNAAQVSVGRELPPESAGQLQALLGGRACSCLPSPCRRPARGGGGVES